jgi:protein O-mannosyl-transferase
VTKTKVKPKIAASSAAPSGEVAGARHRVWVMCSLLGLAVLTVYSPVHNYPFINYDDTAYVSRNPHVQAGLNWATIRWSLTTMEATNWHPLTWLSHALDCELFGLGAGWHHLTNVLIHLATTILLFLLLVRATGTLGRSFVVAGLFGLHPFNVGTVAWIAERKNVLSTLFLLLTLGAYAWYARKPEAKRYLLVIVLFALGLMAKPMMVTLPFALLLLDYWPLRRVAGWSQESKRFPVRELPLSRLISEKLLLLALSLGSSLLTLTAQHEEVQVAAIAYSSRAANAIYSYVLYVWKTLWPQAFSVYYPHPFTNPSIPPGSTVWLTVAAGALLLIAMTFVAWRQRRRRPYLMMGWLWYLGTLVPVIGIVQVGSQGMADRYAYVPLLGIFVIIAWGENELAERLGLTLPWRQSLAAAALLVLAILSFREVGYWKASLDLWLHARAVTTNNYYADVEIGDLLAAERKPEALQFYREAVQFAPWNSETQFPLAVCLQDHRMLQEAADHYAAFIRRSGDRQEVAFAYVNLSIIFGELGDFDRAHTAFDRARRTDPQVVTDMIGSLREAAKAASSDETYFCLGLLLEQSGQFPAARDAYMQALRLNPRQREAQQGLTRLDAGGVQKSKADSPRG